MRVKFFTRLSTKKIKPVSLSYRKEAIIHWWGLLSDLRFSSGGVSRKE